MVEPIETTTAPGASHSSNTIGASPRERAAATTTSALVTASCGVAPARAGTPSSLATAAANAARRFGVGLKTATLLSSRMLASARVMTLPSRNPAIEPVCRSNSTITYSTRGGAVVPRLPISLAPKYLLPDGIDGSTRSQADPSAAIDRGGVAVDELFVPYATRSASTASVQLNTARAASADTNTGVRVMRHSR
jgi:hypothetical protein